MERYQDRGPTSSASYNEQNRAVASRLREVEDGLIKVQERIDDVERSFSAEVSSTDLYAEKVSQLSYSISKSTNGHAVIPVAAMKIIENDNMYVDEKAGLITLKQSAVEHKLRYEPIPGKVIVHPEVLHAYTLLPNETDVDLTNPEYAIDGKSLRSFSAYTTVSKILELSYFVRLPSLAVANNKSNVVSIDLAPAFHCSLVDLQYTTVPNPTLADGAHWVAFPFEADVSTKDRWQVPLGDENVQGEVACRRYYFPDTAITGVRVVVRTKVENENPVPVDIDGSPTFLVGIRDLDVAHVSFASTGHLVAEANLPKPAATIDLEQTRPICVNQGSGLVYEDDLDIYLEQAGEWVKYTGGPAGGATKVRFYIRGSKTDGTSPALSGVDFVYSPVA